MQLAQVELDAGAAKTGAESPALGQLVIAHPPCEIAALACRFMAEDLQVLGVVATLRPLDPGQIVPDDGDWDFVYLDYIAPEPLGDAKRLLAPDGLVKSPSPHLNLALRMLDQVDSWNGAGERLRAIHQISYDDTTLIPLWQLVDHFAYRNVITGIRNTPLSFYQHVEQWAVDVAGGVQ